MTREEYREHLCTIIYMVFTAEHNVIEQNPDLLECLKKNRSQTTADKYVHAIADEILGKTPDFLIPEEYIEESYKMSEDDKKKPP